MTDTKFIKALAKVENISIKESKRLLDDIEMILKTSLSDEKLKVLDLTFSIVDVRPKKIIHPVTREEIYIDASKKIKIFPSDDYRAIARYGIQSDEDFTEE